MKRGFDAAIAVERQALAIAQKASPRDPRILLDLGAMGTYYSLQRKYNEAIQVYERQVALNDAGVTDRQLTGTLNFLAEAYKAVGRDADAAKTHARAMATPNLNVPDDAR